LACYEPRRGLTHKPDKFVSDNGIDSWRTPKRFFKVDHLVCSTVIAIEETREAGFA